MDEVIIRDCQVSAVSPEGQRAAMPVEELVRIVSRPEGIQMDTGGPLPDGVKLVKSRGPITIWGFERPPSVCCLPWIAEDSPAPYGPGTTYRMAQIGLPYTLVFGVFAQSDGGLMKLTSRNECFFRTEPLTSLDDELLYPALLNVSRFTSDPESHSLAWICSTKIDLSRAESERDEAKRMRLSFEALLHCLLETGFNRSSEHHEGDSWYRYSSQLDPRIKTIKTWEKATKRDNLFVLNVPWQKTGYTVGGLIERIFRLSKVRQRPRITSAADVQRILFNYAGAH